MSYLQKLDEIKKQKEYAQRMGITDTMTINWYDIHINLYSEFADTEAEQEKQIEQLTKENNELKTALVDKDKMYGIYQSFVNRIALISKSKINKNEFADAILEKLKLFMSKQ